MLGCSELVTSAARIALTEGVGAAPGRRCPSQDEGPAEERASPRCAPPSHITTRAMDQRALGLPWVPVRARVHTTRRPLRGTT
jgi:hypothetical protein